MGTKSRSNPIRLLAMLLLLITLLFVPTTFAANIQGGGEVNSDGTDADGGGTIGGLVGGWSDIRCGYRMYVINESNSAMSPVLDMWFSNELYAGKGLVRGYEVRGTLRRARAWDDALVQDLADGKCPVPWVNGASNEDSVREWLLTVADGEDINNAEKCIEQVFGEGILDEFRANAAEDPYYLCIEGLANFQIYTEDNKATGAGFYGTFYDYCVMCGKKDWQYGGSMLRSRTNQTFARALMLEENGWSINKWERMAVPVQRNGEISTAQGLDFGYDMLMYRISDLTMNGRIQTYDEALGSTIGPAPEPETEGQKGIFTIVKVYATQMSEDPQDLQYDGCYTRLQVCKNIDILDEPDYTVREWHTSKTVVKNPMPHGTTWPTCKSLKSYGRPAGVGSGSVTLSYDDGDRTLFVLLVRPYEEVELEQDLIIQESEISIFRKLSEVAEWSGVDRKIQWTAPGITFSTCGYSPLHPGGHSESCCSDPTCERCGGSGSYTSSCDHSCTVSTGKVTDGRLKFMVKNELKNAYSHVLATKGSAFEPKIIPEYLSKTKYHVKEQIYKDKEYDYLFVAYRGQDKLTVSNYTTASEKQSFENGIKALTGLTGNTPQGTRWSSLDKAKQEVPLTIKLVKDSAGDYTFQGALVCNHQSAKTSNEVTTDGLTVSAPVTIYTYSGMESPDGYVAGSGSPTGSYAMSGVMRGNGKSVKNDDLVISFYPYIKMTYEERGSNDKHEVNVLSEHVRSMTVQDYAEAGYNRNATNLVIKSQQWSIHQMATKVTEDRPWAGQNKVLPGGAIYNVNGGAGGATLVLRTWQVVVDHDSKAYSAMQASGLSEGLSEHTKAKAEEAHRKYVETAVKVFTNGYYIEQGVNSNPTAKDVFSGDYVTVGRGGFSITGQPLSTETKYYLNNTKESAGNIQSSLLQCGSPKTTPKYYTVSSDTEGNIYLNGEPILDKTENVSDLQKKGLTQAVELNNKTKVISNFLSAIERNTGNDITASWAEGEEDGKWYNEAFAITVLVQTTTINVDLTNPIKRETVLDPVLCPKNTGKSDYFSKAYSSAYRMSSESLVAIEMGKDAGYVSTFKEDTDISIGGIQDMFRSNIFIIPNVNVQDLKD